MEQIAAQYGEKLADKLVVDITNPLDFETFDSLAVPSDSSAAAELAAALPSSTVLKASNTNLAATLSSQSVGGVDAGACKRARELEALGFLQLTRAAGEKTQWTTGFALVHWIRPSPSEVPCRLSL